MPTDPDRTRIRRLQRRGLLNLWRGICTGATPGWRPGKAFEYFILRAFELEGARITYPFSVNLPSGINEQIDGVIYLPDLVVVVESKDSGALNIEPIAKLRNQLQRRPAFAIGAVFSRGGFTDPARALAQHIAPQTILMWEEAEIDLALSRRQMIRGLRAKFRMAVERGLPDFNLLTPGAL